VCDAGTLAWRRGLRKQRGNVSILAHPKQRNIERTIELFGQGRFAARYRLQAALAILIER